MDKIISKIAKYSDLEFEKFLKNEDIKLLHSLKLYLDDIYYNTGENTEISDHQYDLLKEILQERDPKYIPPVGVKIRKDDNKVLLKYWMGSMNKLKPENTNEMARWLLKNKSENYIIEDKLDGISCLLIKENNKINLYTRGDGIIGTDITHILPFIKNIPKTIDNDIVIRGELIMNKEIFYKNYSKMFANPRNMVSGIINAKTKKLGLDNIEFISYELINNYNTESPENQLLKLKKMQFKIVNYSIVDIDEINVSNLIEKTILSKEYSEFEIDGIIVQPNIKYKRNTSGNPDYAFAFKFMLDTNIIDAEVEEVEWNISKRGFLKPRIRIKPVNLNGVKIEYTSGFNARFVYNNKIGKGTVIQLTRSGDVIPHIVKIIHHTIAEMPKVPYKWNKNNVDIIINEKNNMICIKIITDLFHKLKIKHVGESTIEKIYNHGFDNFIKIISASKKDFEKIEGFGNRLAERTYDNIHNSLKDIPITLILGSSGVFGENIGIRRVELLFNEYPNILEIWRKKSKKELFEMINSINGFSDSTTNKIIENLKWAEKFIYLTQKYVSFKENKPVVLNNLIYVFSGFRDSDLENQIIKKGGKVSTSISKNTSFLIIKNLDEKNIKTSKYLKAIELGIPIITKDDFIKSFEN